MNTDRAAFRMPAVYMIMRDGQNNFQKVAIYGID